MKRNIWVTSDWHFNDAEILNYCNRPFKDTEDQTENIIKNHNKLVKPWDVVYVLGDVGVGNIKSIIPKIHGNKILILGNHDRESLNFYLECGFVAVLMGAIINIGETTISLSHYPSRGLYKKLCLFLIYTRKMFSKSRSILQIWQRLKREWKLYFYFGKYPHLHGHTHSHIKKEGKNINVGVDANNFKPVSSNEILNLFRN